MAKQWQAAEKPVCGLRDFCVRNGIKSSITMRPELVAAVCLRIEGILCAGRRHYLTTTRCRSVSLKARSA
jgi:hypothetical protein